MRNGGRFFTSCETRTLRVTLRASRQRPGRNTRILSALSELPASTRFGTQSRISNRTFRRLTKSYSAQSDNLGSLGRKIAQKFLIPPPSRELISCVVFGCALIAARQANNSRQDSGAQLQTRCGSNQHAKEAFRLRRISTAAGGNHSRCPGPTRRICADADWWRQVALFSIAGYNT